jgi:glycerate kinase
MPSWPERPVLVAPGSFRGTFRAAEVAGAIGRGLERAGLLPPDLCPLAAGGEGTIEALLLALGGETAGAEVHDPAGRPLEASFGLIEDGGTAVLEPPPTASTYATGELICAAARAGARVLLLAAAGPAAADGGAGALEAIADHGGLGGARIVVLTAARAPASGLGEALRDAHGAVLEPGVPWILDALGFDARMRDARAVVTGEGRLDEHTLAGGIVGEVGTRTRQAGVPLHAIVGSDALDRFGKRIIDLQVVIEARELGQIETAAETLGRALADGSA